MTNQTQIFDRIHLNTSKIKELGDGSLMVPARFSRAGIQHYGAPRFDALTPVMRKAEDWLDAGTVSQLAGLAITIRHAAMVDEDNVRDLSIGMVATDVHVDAAGYTAGHIIVQGREGKKLILDGDMLELSVGYYATFHQESGIHDGVPYEWVMKPVSMNHVALLERGRAGGARLMLDTGENGLHCFQQQSPSIVPGEHTMTEPKAPEVNSAGQGWLSVVVDGETVKVRQGPADMIVRLAKERDVAVADAAANKTKAEEAEGKIAGMASDLQKIKDAAPDKDALRAEVKDELGRRFILEANCKSVGVEVADSKSDADLMREAIGLLDGDVKIDKMPDAGIGALYTYLLGNEKKASDADKSLRVTLDEIATDKKGDDATPNPVAVALGNIGKKASK